MLLFAGFVGFIVGVVTAATMDFAAPRFIWLNKAWLEYTEACILGTVLGGLIGSITADPNRTSGGVGHNFLVACIGGFFGALLAAHRGDAIVLILTNIHLPVPSFIGTPGSN
jgi:hypothetical protein